MADCDSFNQGKVWRVTLFGEFAGTHEVQNVFQMRYNTPAGTESLANAITDLGEWANDILSLVKLFCSSQMTWDTYAVDGLGGICTSGQTTLGGTITGSLTGDPVPPGVAALLSLKTDVKRVVLRKYFGALAESSVGAGGNLDATTKGLIDDVGDFLLSSYVASSARVYYYGYQSPKTGDFINPHSYVTNGVPGYQRRRRPG